MLLLDLYSMNTGFCCYYGNHYANGESTITQNIVDPYHPDFEGIWYHNLIHLWPNRASKSAIPVFQVSMATFLDFYEFWFFVS